MVSKKSRQKSLPTDIKTDYLFDYFVNIDKFDKRKKKKWDAEKQELNESDEKKIRDHEPKLDSRVFTEAQKAQTKTSASEEELPSTDSSAHKKNVTFNDEISESESSVSTSESQSERKQYGHKISATHHTRKLHRKRRIETPEERRSRSRDAYANLKEMVDKHGIVLTKKFTIDDDPNEMEEEYKMHKNQRDKQNQVKFYGNALLLIVSGIEFLNEKYNPFDFKLKDWSKQVAADKDDYSEVLEELYEKYKDRGGKMAPEIKLVFLIIMSGVTYHLSQTLFGSGGLNDTIEKNPNILNKLLGGLMKGGGIFGGDDKQKTAIPNNKDILENIRKHKTNANASDVQQSPVGQVSPSASVTSPSVVNIDQRAIFEEQLRKQKQMYESQIMDLKNKTQSNKMVSNKVQSPRTPQNQILSDARTRPRFQDNPLLNEMEHTPNIFENEMEVGNVDIGEAEINQALRSAGVKEKSNKYDELEETLDESLSDAKDIIEASSKKTVSKKTKTESATTSKKPKNTSDIVSSARKKNNVIVL